MKFLKLTAALMGAAMFTASALAADDAATK